MGAAADYGLALEPLDLSSAPHSQRAHKRKEGSQVSCSCIVTCEAPLLLRATASWV